MTGILVQYGDRPDILFENGTLYGGLHCGECFDVFTDQWISMRLEYADGWVLINDGAYSILPLGCRVRMENY